MNVLKSYFLQILIISVVIFSPFWLAEAGTVHDSGDATIIRCETFTIDIKKEGFCYSFRRPDGSLIVAPHETSGIQIGDLRNLQSVKQTKYLGSEGNAYHFEVTMTDDLKARVTIKISDHHTHFMVYPETDGKIAIICRTASASPGYGLGDLVANRACPEGFKSEIPPGLGTEITGYDKEDFTSGMPLVRCMTNFAIYPKNGFGVVNIDPWAKIVKSTKDQVAQGSSRTTKIEDLHYFFGTPKQIYAEFLKTRNLRGYPVMLPKYSFFGVGWEAFGALAWRTSQETVTENVNKYLELGYPIRWMVVGSGFWETGLKTGKLGATTSFGMWDKKLYPDPEGFIEYFRSKGLKFFLGLRMGFIVGGPFTSEGLEKDYFLKEDGRPKIFRVGYPREPIYLLDSQNPDALNWYVELCKKWQVDGFKEDIYGYGKYYLRDDMLNPINSELMKEGYYIMGRNGYLGSQSELHRIEDFNYNQDQDRGPINALATAYAGLPYLYPDIIGGTFGGRDFDKEISQRIKTYLMRNAQWASVHPSLSMGKGPWHYKDEQVEKVILDAAKLHDRLHPYIYSQAVRFYHDGYPWPMCPLPIAYYQDPNVDYRENNVIRGYQWMIGDALMATPLYGNDYETATTRDIYLPEGIWMDYDSGEKYTGPKTLKEFSLPVGKTPLFVGGTGIVVEKDQEILVARIYPVADYVTTTFFDKDAVTVSHINIAQPDWEDPRIIDMTTKSEIKGSWVRHAYQFHFQPGHNYLIE